MRERHAVDVAGGDDVGEEQRDLLRLEEAQRRRGMLGLEHMIAELVELPPDDPAHRRVILHHEHRLIVALGRAGRLGELSEAVRARGLKFGFYYSLYEWFNPLWLGDRRRYVDAHLFPQFKDAVTRYKPAIIFADGEWEMTSKQWRSEELLAWLYNESPSREEVVVDDRWGSDTRHKHGGYYTTEYAAGMEGAAHPWEESEGLGYSYGYNRAENLDDYKSARSLVLLLVDTVSRGGNLLLDIGPRADGTIPVIMQQRLVEMGDWLRVNGEAIYGTRFAGRACQWTQGSRPVQGYGEYRVKYDLMEQVGQRPVDGRAVKQVFFTRRPDALYAITAGWPESELVLRGVEASPGRRRQPPRLRRAGKRLCLRHDAHDPGASGFAGSHGLPLRLRVQDRGREAGAGRMRSRPGPASVTAGARRRPRPGGRPAAPAR